MRYTISADKKAPGTEPGAKSQDNGGYPVTSKVYHTTEAQPIIKFSSKPLRSFSSVALNWRGSVNCRYGKGMPKHVRTGV